MNHNLIRKQISSLVDGELSAQETGSVRQHIADCAECQRLLKEFQLLRTEVRAHATEEPSSNFAANVTRAARLQAETQSAWGNVELFARRLVIGLTMVVFFVVSVGSLNSSEQDVVIEPGLSAVSVDSTAQKTLLRGEVSEEDMILAVMER